MIPDGPPPAQAVAVAPSPAGQPACDGASCTLTLSAEELLAVADRLVFARRFEEARPLLAALERSGRFAAETAFLQGYLAAEVGELALAERRLRRALALRPDLVRARLELARVLALSGRHPEADHHFRLAQAAELPEDVAQVVEASREMLRDRDRLGFNLTFGAAPDSNANNGADETSIDLIVDGRKLPAELDEDARRKAGIGAYGLLALRLRRGWSERAWLVTEAVARGARYSGGAPDESYVSLAAGPEARLAPGLRVSLLATGAAHVRGDETALHALGVRSTLEWSRPGAVWTASLKASRLGSELSPAYEGGEVGGAVSYRWALSRTAAAAITAHGSRRWARADAYSGLEAGLAAEVGREWPLGLNAGGSVELSFYRADAPLLLLSQDARRDQRAGLRLFVGSRALRWRGFSPSVTYSYARTWSNLSLYDTDRQRLAFEITRFF